jgi:hypothetical protein
MIDDETIINHNGIRATYLRRQFPFRLANQGNTIHAFNGNTVAKLQIIISYKNSDYNYWSIEQLISAHGRTHDAASITYAPPPGTITPEGENFRDDIRRAIRFAITKKPACGEEFINHLKKRDIFRVISPHRVRRIEADMVDEDVDIEEPIIDASLTETCYLLYSHVSN